MIYVDVTSIGFAKPSGVENVSTSISSAAHDERSLILVQWSENANYYQLSDGARLELPDFEFKFIVSDIVRNVARRKYLLSLKANKKCKLVILLHDLLPIQFPEFFPDLSNIEFLHHLEIVRNASAVITTCATVATSWENFSKRVLSRIDLNQRIFVVDLPSASLSKVCELGVIGSQIRPVNFLVLGNLEPRKNPTMALKICNMLATEGRNVVVNFVGQHNWFVDDFYKYVKENTNSKLKIQIFEGIDNPRLELFWMKADILMYLSEAEGFGLPVTEGLMRDIPTVAWQGLPSVQASQGHPHLFEAPNHNFADIWQATKTALQHVNHSSPRRRLLGSAHANEAMVEWGRTFLKTVDQI
jgi:glycosyltransferase involved in cell wall biosynthesis